MEQVVLLSLAGLWLIVILLFFIYMIYSMVDFIKDGDWGYALACAIVIIAMITCAANLIFKILEN